MSDLPKRLRIKASMIALGERIAWGSDTALMEEAADVIEALSASVENHQLHMLGMARDRDQLRAMLTAQPQASAAQSAPAGEREDWSQALLSVAVVLEALRSNDTAARLANMDAGKVLGEAYAKLKRIRASWQCTQSAGVPEGWRLVPVEPTEEMWSGLARHLMMWLDFGNPTVEALRKHLDMLNIEWPAWMDAESELRGSGVPSKGTRATLIYKAMLAAAPAQPAAQGQGEVQRLREALNWLRGAINCTAENDVDQCGAWISTKHPMIQRIDELLAASTGQEV